MQTHPPLQGYVAVNWSSLSERYRQLLHSVPRNSVQLWTKLPWLSWQHLASYTWGWEFGYGGYSLLNLYSVQKWWLILPAMSRDLSGAVHQLSISVVVCFVALYCGGISSLPIATHVVTQISGCHCFLMQSCTVVCLCWNVEHFLCDFFYVI